MSIKQEFMDMLSTLQQPNSLEYRIEDDIFSQLTLSSTVSNIIVQIEETSENNQSLNILKKQLLNYLEIESMVKKMCSLNYSLCIKFASSKELNIIANEVKQYRSIFANMFTICEIYLNDLFVNDNFSCVQTTLRNQLSEIYSFILNVIEDYLIKIDDRLSFLSGLIKINFDNNNIIKSCLTSNNIIKSCLTSSKSNTSEFRKFRSPSIDPSIYRQNNKRLSDTERSELKQLISSVHVEPFNSLLFKYIDKVGMTDAQVYSAAGISKQVFSYLRTGKQRSLKKENVVSICIVLRLNIKNTTELLESCGYSLSEYITFDRIIKFCINKGCYDIFEINELLVEYNQPTICGIVD